MITRIVRHNARKVVFGAAFIAGLLLGSGPVYSAPQSISNDKELGLALKNARTPDDHRRIAVYYEEKAQKLQQKEKEEQDLANYFATHPSMYGKMYPTPYQNHKNLADYYHRAANIALQKAKEHRETSDSLSPSSHGEVANPGQNVQPTTRKVMGPQISS
jgi:hypothetical protein